MRGPCGDQRNNDEAKNEMIDTCMDNSGPPPVNIIPSIAAANAWKAKRRYEGLICMTKDLVLGLLLLALLLLPNPPILLTLQLVVQ